MSPQHVLFWTLRLYLTSISHVCVFVCVVVVSLLCLCCGCVVVVSLLWLWLWLCLCLCCVCVVVSVSVSVSVSVCVRACIFACTSVYLQYFACLRSASSTWPIAVGAVAAACILGGAAVFAVLRRRKQAGTVGTGTEKEVRLPPTFRSFHSLRSTRLHPPHVLILSVCLFACFVCLCSQADRPTVAFTNPVYQDHSNREGLHPICLPVFAFVCFPTPAPIATYPHTQLLV